MKYFLIDKLNNVIKAITTKPIVVVDADKDMYTVVSLDDTKAPYMNLDYYTLSQDENGNYVVTPKTEEEIEQIKKQRYDEFKGVLLQDLDRLVMDYIRDSLFDWGSSYQEILTELQNTAQVKKIYCLSLLVLNNIQATESTITNMFLEAYNKHTFTLLNDTIKSLSTDDQAKFKESFIQGCIAAIYQFWIEKIWDWVEEQDKLILSKTYPEEFPIYNRTLLEDQFPKPDTSFLNSLRS